MSYEIDVLEHERYLKITARGTRSVQAAEELYRRIDNEVKRRNVYKVLVVLDLQGSLTTLETYDLLSTVPNYEALARCKIVAVDQNPAMRAHHRFAETVAKNRGIHGVFSDQEENALRWLLLE